MSTVLLQGSDFKAKKWAEHINADCLFFHSATELISLIRKCPGRKLVVFRYQNSQKTLASDLAYTFIMFCILALRRPLKLQLFWIMHNIDRETIDRFPLFTKLRRSMLTRSSKRIFVTDAYFKRMHFSDVDKVRSISFGPKTGGTISPSDLSSIKELKKKADIVVLCVGAIGEKYAHFERLDILVSEAAKKNKKLALVLPVAVQYSGCAVVNLAEKNIDERQLIGNVDFVYRINDDISMPYTIYAASSARIPLVSFTSFYTSKIIEEYGLGFSEEHFVAATSAQIEAVRENMDEFLRSRAWSSLGDNLC